MLTLLNDYLRSKDSLYQQAHSQATDEVESYIAKTDKHILSKPLHQCSDVPYVSLGHVNYSSKADKLSSNELKWRSFKGKVQDVLGPSYTGNTHVQLKYLTGGGPWESMSYRPDNRKIQLKLAKSNIVDIEDLIRAPEKKVRSTIHNYDRMTANQWLDNEKGVASWMLCVSAADTRAAMLYNKLCGIRYNQEQVDYMSSKKLQIK